MGPFSARYVPWSRSPRSQRQPAGDSICHNQARSPSRSVRAPIARCPSVGQLPRPVRVSAARLSCWWTSTWMSLTVSRSGSVCQRHSASQSLRARWTSRLSGEGRAPSSRLLTDWTTRGCCPSLRRRTRERSTGSPTGEDSSTKAVNSLPGSWSSTVRYVQPSRFPGGVAQVPEAGAEGRTGEAGARPAAAVTEGGELDQVERCVRAGFGCRCPGGGAPARRGPGVGAGQPDQPQDPVGAGGELGLQGAVAPAEVLLSGGAGGRARRIRRTGQRLPLPMPPAPTV